MSPTIGAPVSLDYLTPCCLSSLCSSHWPRPHHDPSTLAQLAGVIGVHCLHPCTQLKFIMALSDWQPAAQVNKGHS